MKYQFVHKEVIQHLIEVEADSQAQADARASCGSIKTILRREGVTQLGKEERTEVYRRLFLSVREQGEVEAEPFSVSRE